MSIQALCGWTEMRNTVNELRDGGMLINKQKLTWTTPTKEQQTNRHVFLMRVPQSSKG